MLNDILKIMAITGISLFILLKVSMFLGVAYLILAMGGVL